jgi:hypothetical protein
MKLLFVYNADSGLLNTLKDTVHKAIAPETYACNLCRITYGAISMRDEWKNFIAGLPHDVAFMHRDEFVRAYPGTHADLPALFSADEAPRVLVSAKEMNDAKTIRALIDLVTTALSLTHA